MEVLDLKTMYVILHLIGTVIGMGGALTSDAMFFASVRDKIISRTELRFLKLGGRLTWIGLALIFISGALLFSLDPIGYMDSSKFLVKMTIVGIIVLNGIVIHKMHFPAMKAAQGKRMKNSPVFQKDASLMLASGAVSVVSWFSALILGSLRSIPYTYIEGMGIYVVVTFVAVLIALSLKRRILV